MASEFDHLFICTFTGADEAADLAAFGLSEGMPNTHPGQGTACRRFFFCNAYLELLWVHDPAEAQSAPIQPTHLWERWTGRGRVACPFGFGFRPVAQQVGSLPFATWEYHPPYLPAPVSFHVGTNADILTEPLLFYVPFAQRPDTYPRAKRPLMEHTSGLREITRVEFISPHSESLSRELQAVAKAELVRHSAGPEYLVELGFDGELKGRTADFRPALPLVFHW